MRVTYVKKSQKDQGYCESCHAPIPVGAAYKWIKPRHGAKRRRHMDCPTWRPSEMTTSNQLSMIYAATEAAEDALGAWDRESLDDLKSILDECAEGLREAAEEYRTSASNIEDGFGHSTYVSDELTEKADNVEGWADEIEQALDSVEEWDEDEAKNEVITEGTVEGAWWIVGDDGTEIIEDNDYRFEMRDDADYQLKEWRRTGRLGEDEGEVKYMPADADDEDLEAAIAEKRDEWADNCITEIEGALGNCPV